MKPFIKIGSVFLVLLFAYAHGSAQVSYERKILPASSSGNNEMAPVLLGDKLVFISDREVAGPRSGTDMNGKTFFKIVQCEKDSKGNWKRSHTTFDRSVQTKYHDGPVSFNDRGDYMVFSRVIDEKPGTKTRSRLGLFFADKQDSIWGNIQEFPYNDADSNTIEPAFNKDASALYFSSNRAGSGAFGGYDLYVSYYKNGAWQAPENLGPSINTAANEFFPFFHPSARLYFSSNGRANKNLYEIYYSIKDKGKWIKEPVKLPSDINNGKQNAYTYWADEDFQNMFFTLGANRKNAKRDIYYYASKISYKFPIDIKPQRKNNYCYVFFEENTAELDTTLYQYEWNLGDNTKVRAIEAKHCFAKPGDYTVSLNIIDKLTKEVLFSQAEYELNVRPEIQCFVTSADTVKVNEPVLFDGSQSYFGGEEAEIYRWDFKDGDKTNGQIVTHTFLVAGVYDVRLGIKKKDPESNSKGNKSAKGNEAEKITLEFARYKTIVVTEN